MAGDTDTEEGGGGRAGLHNLLHTLRYSLSLTHTHACCLLWFVIGARIMLERREKGQEMERL